MKYTQIITALALSVGSVQAAVTITDFGATAPIGSVAAHTVGGSEFGWDGTETFGQSFTLASAGTLDSIYIGYRGNNNTASQVVTVAVDGTGFAATLDGSAMRLDGSKTDYNWAKIDFSGESIALAAGSHDFLLSSAPSTWIIAPQYELSGGYSGGTAQGNIVGGGSDLVFAVTTAVPEPSSAALLGLGGLALIMRRRK